MQLSSRHFAAIVMTGSLALLAACGTTPNTRSGTEEAIVRAQATLDNFQRDPEMTWFRDNVKQARAVIISPRVTRAGLVFGGSGGEAVVLARDPARGGWSAPAFYNIGAGSVGFQFGLDVSEVVMLVMTDRAFNALLSPTFRIGADASIAAGPVGVGAASTVRADIISFARSRGVYAGVSLDGTVIRPDSRANQAFYGSEVSPVDILVRRSATSPAANPLQQSLERMSR